MKTQDALALWIIDECFENETYRIQKIIVDDVRERLVDGESLESAIKAVNNPRAQAGDFGVDISGSTVAVLMLHVLVGYWAAYVNELKKKSVKKLADATVEFVKRSFAKDIHGPDGRKMLAALESALRKRAEEQKIPKKKVEELIDALRTSRPFRDVHTGGPNAD